VKLIIRNIDTTDFIISTPAIKAFTKIYEPLTGPYPISGNIETLDIHIKPVQSIQN